jgi:hypothetical protein
VKFGHHQLRDEPVSAENALRLQSLAMDRGNSRAVIDASPGQIDADGCGFNVAFTIAADCFGLQRQNVVLSCSRTGNEPVRISSPYSQDHEDRLETLRQRYLAGAGREHTDNEREIQFERIRSDHDEQAMRAGTLERRPIAQLQQLVGGFADVNFTAVDRTAWPEPTFNADPEVQKRGSQQSFMIAINAPKVKNTSEDGHTRLMDLPRGVKLFGIELCIREAGVDAEDAWCELGGSPLDQSRFEGGMQSCVYHAEFSPKTLADSNFNLAVGTFYEVKARYVFVLASHGARKKIFEASAWASTCPHTKFTTKMSREEIKQARTTQILQRQQAAEAAEAAAAAVVPAAAALSVQLSPVPGGAAMEIDEQQGDVAHSEDTALAGGAAATLSPAASPAASPVHTNASTATQKRPRTATRTEAAGPVSPVAAAAAPATAAPAAAVSTMSIRNLSSLKPEAKMLAELQRLDHAAGGGDDYSRYYQPLVQAGIRNVLDLASLDAEDADQIEVLKDQPPLKKKCFIKNVARINQKQAAATAAMDRQLVCPFTQEAFRDRVRFKSEITRQIDDNFYERAMIERWLHTEHKRSPLTNQDLQGQDLTLESV